MNHLKKYAGLVWILLAIVAITLLCYAAYTNIAAHGKHDINKPLPWIIIITVFTPVAFGLGIFGYYALKDEYKQ